MTTKTQSLLRVAKTLLVILTAAHDVSAQLGSIVYSDQKTHQIHSVNPDGSGSRVLTSGFGSFPAWSKDMRYIGFHRSTTMEDTIYVMEAIGERNGGRIFPVVVDAGNSGLDWSADGLSIVFPGNADGLWSVTVDPDSGTVGTPILLRAGLCAAPACSPVGTRIAFVSYPGARISVLDLNNGTDTVVGDGYAPSFSPDGSLIAYRAVGPATKGRTTNWHPQIFVMNFDGTGQTQLTSQTDYLNFPRWSPNGDAIAFWKQVNGADSIHKLSLVTGITSLVKKGGNIFDWAP